MSKREREREKRGNKSVYVSTGVVGIKEKGFLPLLDGCDSSARGEVEYKRTLFAGFSLSFSKIFWDSALEAAILGVREWATKTNPPKGNRCERERWKERERSGWKEISKHKLSPRKVSGEEKEKRREGIRR